MFQLFAQTAPALQNLSSKPLLLVLLGFGGAVLLFAFMPQIGNFILGIFGKKIVDVVAPSQAIRSTLLGRMRTLSEQPGFDDPATPVGKEFSSVASAAAATNSALPGTGILQNLTSSPMLMIALVVGFFLVTQGGGCGGGTGGCSMTKPPVIQPKGE